LDGIAAGRHSLLRLSSIEFDRLVTALAREMQRSGTNEVRIHLGDQARYGPFEWTMRDPLRFGGGLTVRLIAPMLKTLSSEAANALASLVEPLGTPGNY
jgi:hypothetical protein